MSRKDDLDCNTYLPDHPNSIGYESLNSSQSSNSTSPSILNNIRKRYIYNKEHEENSKLGTIPDSISGSSSLNSVINECTSNKASDRVTIASKVEEAKMKMETSKIIDINNIKEEPVDNKPKAQDVRMISGVSVEFPVKPYPAQIALMSKVIRGITLQENCLLESPTGSGKTLALLCSSLAWQRQEKERIQKLVEQTREIERNLFESYNYSPKKQFQVLGQPQDVHPCCSNNSPSKAAVPLPDKKVKVNKKKSPYFDDPVEESNTKQKANKKSKKPIYYDNSDEETADLFVQKDNKGKSTKGFDETATDGSTERYHGTGVPESVPYERTTVKRQEFSPDSAGYGDLVAIHKRPRMFDSNSPTNQMKGIAMMALSSPVKSPLKNSIGGDQLSIENNPNSLTRDKIQKMFEDIPKVPRILFGTRTHKQLEQIVKELKRTTYAKGLKMSILSSREHTCIKKLPNSFKSKTEYCKNLMDKSKYKTLDSESPTQHGCSFYDNKHYLVGQRAPQDVWDIEELVHLGTKRKACPYFAARDMADYADIVFCPYNYVLDPLIRSSIKLTLHGDIVLIDEGHNIEDVCRETASYTMELSNVETSIQELEHLITAKPMSDNDTNEVFVYFKKYFQDWNDWFENHIPLMQKQSQSDSVYLMDGMELADSLNRHGIGFQQYEKFKIMVNIALTDLRDTKIEEELKRLIPTSTGIILESLCIVLDYLFRNKCGNLDDYKGILNKKAEFSLANTGWFRKGMKKTFEESGIKMSLKICCMNSALVFDGISQNARSVILASGTLTPTLSFPAELGTTFPHTLQAGHVISSNQVWVGSLDSGPNGVPLEATFKNTSRPEWQDALGEILLWVCDHVPHGVLCFVSSYRLMEILQERWQATGLWSRLESTKTIFSESRRMNEHDQIMTDFYSCVGETGAILFAVFRGKVSEGMDFRDHQARAVITVGIPYPNVKDIMIEGKMKYNESHKADRSLVSGRDWLQIQAYRALNQALGRCIRHKNDWGAVIMIDSRFKHPSYTMHISKWVRNFLADRHHSWESLTAGPCNLVRFMDEMKLSQPDTT